MANTSAWIAESVLAPGGYEVRLRKNPVIEHLSGFVALWLGRNGYLTEWFTRTVPGPEQTQTSIDRAVAPAERCADAVSTQKGTV
jgi:hypothetical protein